MKRVILSAALVCLAGLGAYAQKRLPYRDASLPVEQRVGDLLSRMTLEEKVGQLRCTLAWNYYEIKGNKVVPSPEFVKDLTEGHIGMLWATYRADPWTRKSLVNGLTPTLAAKAGNALQKYVIEHTRLGIYQNNYMLRRNKSYIVFNEELGTLESTGRSISYYPERFAELVATFRKNYANLPAILEKNDVKGALKDKYLKATY